LQFDASHAPVVAGQTMFVASSVDDSVAAYDLNTGELKWRFGAGGPVRFAPLVHDTGVIFGADDGVVYCLDAASGEIRWKHNTAPRARKVIGNERLISVWPIRGGPMLVAGKLLFTIGVWPFEGTFLVGLDPATGKEVAPLPNAPVGPVVLDDRTPQGYLAASAKQLFIPCGRSVATAFDRDTGALLSYSYSTSSHTNYHVATAGQWLLHGAVLFDTQSKAALPRIGHEPVAAKEAVYAAVNDTIVAYDLVKPKVVVSRDRRGKEVKKTVLVQKWAKKVTDAKLKPTAKQPAKVLIKAGDRLYGNVEGTLFAFETNAADDEPQVSWTAAIEGTPKSMVAANGKLLAVTAEGSIYCFGEGPGDAREFKLAAAKPPAADAASELAARILKSSNVGNGYCLVWGLQDGRLAEELVRQSDVNVIAVDSRSDVVQRVRRRLEQTGLYGRRLHVLEGDISKLDLPPYFANLIVSELAGRTAEELIGATPALYRTLRPYGGLAMLPTSDERHKALSGAIGAAQLAQAKVSRDRELTLVRRVGALPGSADWTHEYGDPTNSLMSRDQLVKAPLGVLWFGGPASDGSLFYNRHFWGPSLTVIEGRMFVQGPDKMTAVDVYTGRILWQTPVKGNQNYNAGRRGNDFENQIAGYHFLAVRDGIYLVNGRDLIRLDPATGKELSRFQPPQKKGAWGRIRVQGDLLLGSVFTEREGLGKLPTHLVALNRQTGEVVWQQNANLSFPHVAISRDKVYCFDGAIEDLYRDWKRKGRIPKAADIRLLKAYDLKTGKPLWERSSEMVVTWLGFSQDHDVLVTSNRDGMTAWSGKAGDELWKKKSTGQGFKGHPENLWDRVILWKDRIIDQRGPGLAYNILTGESTQRLHPVTKEPIDWEFTKAGHHCNYAIANPHMLTFRAASAGFCDIDSGNTAHLEGYRSGCRNSLIPANGVLNSPNFAHGCVCGYSLFTSLALIHVPDNEVWSYNALKASKKSVERLGINFGAPGDRVSPTGTLWLDYPNVGGSSPDANVKLTGKKPTYFREHSAFVAGEDMSWVAASGFRGAATLAIRTNQAADKKPRGYRVRLHFAEPDAAEPGARTFDVSVQGAVVLENFDVARESTGADRAVVREFSTNDKDGLITIVLSARTGVPVISGVEVLASEGD
jgi:outer membrane protein assembly factor BamB